MIKFIDDMLIKFWGFLFYFFFCVLLYFCIQFTKICWLGL